MEDNFINIFIEGPDVSFKGSPIVSLISIASYNLHKIVSQHLLYNMKHP
jgi:hypothetical protein